MDVKKFILQNINKHPTDIIKVTMEYCKISRKTVYKHLNRLIKDGLIYKKQRGHYALLSKTEKIQRFEILTNLQEDIIWNKYFKDIFKDLSKNLYDICIYGFTEMLNNVIDHSEGKTVTVKAEIKNKTIIITILDDGIGIFNKIKNAFNLEDLREALFQLTKGKLTTDPEKHTGEGIFFTSRAFDRFSILSGSLFYYKSELENDWYIETRTEHNEGTSVRMQITINSPRNLRNVFAKYTGAEDNKFNKTHIIVDLAKFEEETYISRSQAKRILFGLEKFEHIVLDFKKVSTVGQAFVDEVFRVYKNSNPDIIIEYQNANDDIQFMIKRTIQED